MSCPDCEHPTPKNLSRRLFLRNGALALAGVALAPSFLSRAALAAPGRGRVLVVVFQRGAADPLSMVVPYMEGTYYSKRRLTAIARPGGEEGAIDLDGTFGLHPSLGALKPLWDRRLLGVVLATGSPDATRSHFDAQDYMEAGAPGDKHVHDGWLNRVMGAQPRKAAFRGVSMTAGLPHSLQGPTPALAIPNLRSFGVRGGGKTVENGFEDMYAKGVDDTLHGTGRESFEAVDTLRRKVARDYQPANGATYPRGSFGQQMQQVAQLIKADVGLEIACTESGGWDTHANQRGQMATRLQELAGALAAFAQDLGDGMQDVLVLTMSEFGRTVAENGSGGTDHGHANLNFVLGGRARGGRVHGQWPGLAPERLYEGRDLAVTTDFRDVFGEIVVRYLQCQNVSTIFPHYAISPGRFRGIVQA